MMTPSISLASPASGTTVRVDRFRGFVDTHYDRLWRIVRRFGVPPEQVEDVVQDVLIVLSKRLRDIEPRAEWAFAIQTARRLAADGRRRDAVRERSMDEITHIEAIREEGARNVDATQERQLLDRLLDELPDEQREVLVLVELEGLTMSEVAQLLDVPNGTVASRLRRARTHLEASAARLRAELLGQGWSV